MPNAVVVHEVGGPDKLTFESVPEPAPGPGEARIRQTAVGLNFIDVYYRTGLYKAPALPFVPGQEGAGIVEAVGPDVTDVAVGDRVAYAGKLGGYAEVRVIPADQLVRLPAGIDDKVAAAMMLKGMTAEFLLLRCARVARGDTILFHAAAGGVGSIACQWAHTLGVRVIGTAGGPEKVALARQNGCAEVIDLKREDLVARVKELTGGAGVRAVFDSIGKDTFAASLDCLGRRGLLVLFGQSSGVVPPIDPASLLARGSLFLTRPSMLHYLGTREELVQSAERLFDVVGRGAVRISIGQSYPLRDAARAHADLEARRTTGSTVLLP
ncbi:MAG TPA: quinone oxidoreductase [Polyangia bacterium]|nr:quinone oxidoreductase [Polyangia bacterium]